jgi:hypothetical protein
MRTTVANVRQRARHTSDSTERPAVYAGRAGPGGRQHMLNTPVGVKGWLGNPFRVGESSVATCLERFEAAFPRLPGP